MHMSGSWGVRSTWFIVVLNVIASHGVRYGAVTVMTMAVALGCCGRWQQRWDVTVDTYAQGSA